MRRRGERGQALVMVAAALGIFLLGAVGLATDVGRLYAERQIAQSAADAGAQAGIMSIFNGTNTGPNAFGGTAFTCGAGDARIPCAYARYNLIRNVPGDTISVEFPAAGSVPGVPNSVSLIRVTVQRQVGTTFMRLLGPAAGTVAASATAAVLEVQSPVPIIIIHPTLPASFHKNGSNNIIICGGPEKSIQVNSTIPSQCDSMATAAWSIFRAPVRTRPAPLACDGSGGDFGNHGGPSPYPGTLLLGDNGRLHLARIRDPGPPSECPTPYAPSSERRQLSKSHAGERRLSGDPPCRRRVPALQSREVHRWHYTRREQQGIRVLSAWYLLPERRRLSSALKQHRQDGRASK